MTPMDDVSYLIGTEQVVNSPLRVFDTEVRAFIAELSSLILSSPAIRALPDLATLGFWGRKGNILKIQREFGPTQSRIGRGLCFHIAPSNIPINFAFSWLFSMLAGNANIVRLPSKPFPQVEEFCLLAARIINVFPRVKERTALIQYPRDNNITAAFCAQADARMIWGGDKTIALVKTMPTPPRCVDVTFSDRYSVAILDGAAILKTDEVGLRHLANNFYNDTFLMDQNACSSPQIILWQNDNANARNIFWDAVTVCAKDKYHLQDVVVVDKYTALCEEAIANPNLKSVRRIGNLLYCLELEKLTHDVVERRGSGGLFYEYSLKNWQELFNIVTPKFQTVTCFGVDKDAFLDAVIMMNLRGVDRVVPVGKSMDISTIWDGYNLVEVLSRTVSRS